MSLFVDASALVAIIAREPEREAFADRIETSGVALWSAMSAWETVSALARTRSGNVDQACDRTEKIASVLRLKLIPIGAEELRVALDAYQRFGKGRHPARLNMGDCFAYACAKTNGARLLYKGEDFAQTDMA